METDFNVICEDESTDELGDLLCNMWRMCGEGSVLVIYISRLELIDKYIRRLYSRYQRPGP